MAKAAWCKKGKERRASRRCLSVPLGRYPFGGGTLAGCPQAQGANREVPAAQGQAGTSEALPHFRCPIIELRLCCAFLQEAKSRRGSPLQPCMGHSGSQRTWEAREGSPAFPLSTQRTGKGMEALCCPPSCTSSTLLQRRREGWGVICARRRPGAHYIFFETPVKTGINTRLPELQSGSCPLLTVLWRLQSKLIEIKDSNNIAIESQEPSVVRFNSHRSVNTGRWPWRGRNGKADQQALCCWFYRDR